MEGFFVAEDCIFCKIGRGEIPAEIVYETEEVVAFKDLDPQAPLHVLIIPKKHIATMNDIGPADDGIAEEIFSAARKIADNENISADGYRLVVNCNKSAGQEVFHLHAHLLGGRKFSWPPG
ncbi:MAG: histidine triad nucleotide-binding protein [Candidatus Omnitrophota bacterium]